ncbi:MAG TPA: flagellar hook basal-body protein [Pirellulaceae bacterium]|nr:flagellar hook basal-body protein [Pirellulaceae bacterium]HMO90907.1 flagellar hook basal-body protein [Pirellulaceae bacterium]HMP68617.1 flagellar hook basal-body protein [Pirellulaceae bacterium]
MIRALYESAIALDALGYQQEVISANLAHVNTPGHRRLLFTFAELGDDAGISLEDKEKPSKEKLAVDFSLGRMETTGRPLDLAIQGDAFFVYGGSEGPMYSRNGVVFLDPATKHLVNNDGFPLLDEKNEPVTFNGQVRDLMVSSDGILTSKGQRVGKIAVVAFDDKQKLDSENQIYFRSGDAQTVEPTQFAVLQGIRELSNVSPIVELIALMNGARSYEVTQRVLRTISDALQEHIKS